LLNASMGDVPMKKKVHEIYSYKASSAKFAATEGVLFPGNFLDFVKNIAEGFNSDRYCKIKDDLYDPVLFSELVSVSEKILANNGDESLYYSYRLGELLMLNRLIKEEENLSRSRGKRTKRKLWASLLAEELVGSYPDSSFGHLWDNIPESEYAEDSFYDGYEVYRSEDVVYATKASDLGDTLKSEKLSRSTFRTNYVAKAKNKQ